MSKATVKKIAYWTTTVLGPASFVVGGILNLTQADQAIATLQHLGYPAYFAFILGTGKLLGALAIVLPGRQRIKEWAYAGFFFNLTAAAFSRAAVGDPAADVIAPLVFLAFVMASWALQPYRATVKDEREASLGAEARSAKAAAERNRAALASAA